MQPVDTHLDLTRTRHGELLRMARNGELAARLADARQEERRSLAARLRARGARSAPRPSTAS
jgi:hypothetical protein